MSRLQEIIVEHTKLAKEFISFPINGGNTEEEALAIAKRKVEIKQRIEALRKERIELYGK